ncbi:MAG TPA: LuxR C-terminal-related transcriptional regulator [Bacteroidia bacterium]|nr:LuxR C-terminal-related transcriptional regulator [Bacteroidia bacterium]
MNSPGKCSLAIYDEHQMQRELLHHQLERMRFEVLFSCKLKKELQKYIQYHSPDLLLVNSENSVSQNDDFISGLIKKELVQGIIFYNSLPSDILSSAKKKKTGVNIYFVSGGFATLVAMLDEINRPRKAEPLMQESSRSHTLLPDNPFYKIAGNDKYIRILEMLKDGMVFKQIADVLLVSEHTVKTYVKRMHEETGYTNTIQLVYKAREYGLI